MSIPNLDLPHVHLQPGEDAELARAIEAGVYARHLIEGGNTDPRLPAVVASGHSAAERLAHVGLRMALKLAQRTAYVTGLPDDELFQDGCVAVAEAIWRFDHRREVRFTTFVHEYLSRAMAEGGHHRLGRPTVSRADRRAARLADDDAEVRVSPTAASRGRLRHVSLDDVALIDASAEQRYEQIAEHGLDFLDLLRPRHSSVLKLRFGLDGRALTLAEIADLVRASPSSVARWEREALAAARALLSQERTTTAAHQVAAAVVA